MSMVYRYRCAACKQDFCGQCCTTPYHAGLTCHQQAAPKCLYCKNPLLDDPPLEPEMYAVTVAMQQPTCLNILGRQTVPWYNHFVQESTVVSGDTCCCACAYVADTSNSIALTFPSHLALALFCWMGSEGRDGGIVPTSGALFRACLQISKQVKLVLHCLASCSSANVSCLLLS